MVRPDPERLGRASARRAAAATSGSSSASERLGQQAEGADGRLELVADVGHEVAAHGLEAAALGDVVDHHERAAGSAALLEADGP